MHRHRTNTESIAEVTANQVPKLLDYNALAEITGEGISTLRRRKMLGTGPKALRIGRHIRFHPQDVAEWLSNLRQEACA